jgi:tRNA modification GTPase
MFEQDTIVALATPPGVGGIGILRLSGPRAPELLKKFWMAKNGAEFSSHQLYYGDLIDPHNQQKLDRGLAVWMKSPRSFTGEEVVEFHLHGGPLLLNQILSVLLRERVRLAEPGEFTQRAFLNGKLDLLQAEAIGEMIHANSEAALYNARGQLEGRISSEVEHAREQLLHLLALVESAIDFPDEDIEIAQPKQILAQLTPLHQRLETWLQKFHIGRLLREGVKVALVGRPNVGKSSLLNRLLGEDRAIVHHLPGTTRDVVEGILSVHGVAFQLFDTAGIRAGEDEVEQEGISRSRRAIQRADLTLWIIDGSSSLTPEDRAVLSSLEKQVLLVFNKIDLGSVVEKIPPEWITQLKDQPVAVSKVSAKNGVGLEQLRQTMIQAAGLRSLEECSHAYLNNARHLEALRSGLEALNRAKDSLHSKPSFECLAADLREAKNSLESLLGKISSEDVLGKIFSNFCIGK